MRLILIDCENVSYNEFLKLMPNYKDYKAYAFADFLNAKQWNLKNLRQLKIIPVSTIHCPGKKNKADFVLLRYALTHILTDNVSELVLFSSDSDFSDLISFAKSKNINIIIHSKTNPAKTPNAKIIQNLYKEYLMDLNWNNFTNKLNDTGLKPNDFGRNTWKKVCSMLGLKLYDKDAMINEIFMNYQDNFVLFAKNARLSNLNPNHFKQPTWAGVYEKLLMQNL